jgi:molybdopterin converting factor small subunit
VVRAQDVARRRPWPKILAERAYARLRAMLHAGELERELQRARTQEATLAAERDAYLRQRDEAIGERNEFLRQRDEALAAGDRVATHLAHLQAGARARFRPAHQRSPQNSIFLATLPKSGTEFVRGGIHDATQLIDPQQLWDAELVQQFWTGYCNRTDVGGTGLFVSERLNLSELSNLVPNGFLQASHCMDNYHNLCTLRDAPFKRASVLVRDPRDATVSWTHHVRTLPPHLLHFNSFTQHLPADYLEWTHQRQLSFQVRTFLPAAINWIESWLDAAEVSEHGLSIQIIPFPMLRDDPLRMFEEIFAFHGIADYDLSRIKPPTVGERNFRDGSSGAWREEFSEEDRALAASLMGSRIERILERLAVE